MALNVLIKPIGAACNLKCKYCFYTSAEHVTVKMNYAAIDAVADAITEYENEEIWILFQGGEPLLAGAAFYEQFLSAIKRRSENCTVHYSIQTNATLIDRAWCKLFKSNGFLVGVSLDGTKYINDKNRLDANGKSAYSAVIQAIKLLEQTGVEYNILAVITKELCKHREETLNFFFTRYKYLQFTMPVQEPWNSSVIPSNDEMAEFLNAAFKKYYDNIISGKYVSVRYFDNLINMAAGKPSEQCGLDGKCPGYLLIDGDLNCYPCDFYVNANYKLGTIGVDSISEMLNSSQMNAFKREVETSALCKNCEVYDLCRIGCKRYRIDGHHYYCNAVKQFLIKNTNAIKNLAKTLYRQRL